MAHEIDIKLRAKADADGKWHEMVLLCHFCTLALTSNRLGLTRRAMLMTRFNLTHS